MRRNLITTLGIIVAFLPFVTIPSSIKNPIYILLGASIAYTYYRERHMKKKGTYISSQRKPRRPGGATTPVSVDSIKIPENGAQESPKEQ